MICTVTPNVAIDKAYVLENPIHIGAVQRVSKCINTAGGKGLNAARAVHAAGAEVLATGIVGGTNGRLAQQLLDEDGCAHDFVTCDAQTRCCINVLASDNTTTEFLESGQEVSRAVVDALFERVGTISQKANVITFNGSLPKGMKSEDYVTLIEMSKACNIPVILDTSGDALIKGVTAKPTMVKPNENELAQLTGRPTTDIPEIKRAAKALHALGIDTVVVSLGAKGALMVCNEGVFQATPPAIKPINTVGSGDTLVGTFAVSMERKEDRAQTLAFAIACATANCLTPSTGSFELSVARDILADVKLIELN